MKNSIYLFAVLLLLTGVYKETTTVAIQTSEKSAIEITNDSLPIQARKGADLGDLPIGTRATKRTGTY